MQLECGDLITPAILSMALVLLVICLVLYYPVSGILSQPASMASRTSQTYGRQQRDLVIWDESTVTHQNRLLMLLPTEWMAWCIGNHVYILVPEHHTAPELQSDAACSNAKAKAICLTAGGTGHMRLVCIHHTRAELLESYAGRNVPVRHRSNLGDAPTLLAFINLVVARYGRVTAAAAAAAADDVDDDDDGVESTEAVLRAWVGQHSVPPDAGLRARLLQAITLGGGAGGRL